MSSQTYWMYSYNYPSAWQNPTVVGVSNGGTVVGTYYTSAGSYSFTYNQGGTATTFGPATTRVLGISSSGVLAGNTGAIAEGFTGALVPTATSADIGSQVVGISDGGTIAGTYETFTNQYGEKWWAYYAAPLTYSQTNFALPSNSVSSGVQVIGHSGGIAGTFSTDTGGTYLFAQTAAGKASSFSVATQIVPGGWTNFTEDYVSGTGNVVGYFYDLTGLHRFVYGNAVTYNHSPTGVPVSYSHFLTRIDPASGSVTDVRGISDNGVVAGNMLTAQGTQAGFVLTYVDPTGSTRTYVNLTPAGATQSSVAAINAGGTVVGNYVDAQAANHGLISVEGANATTLNAPGALSTYIDCINDAGQIAGTYVVLNLAAASTTLYGYVYDQTSGSWSSFALPAGAVIGKVDSISAGGAVAGHYLDQSSVVHGFDASVQASQPVGGTLTAAVAAAMFNAGTLPAASQVSDSAANIQTNLNNLQAMAATGLLAAISLTDGGTPTMTVTAAQLTADATALNDITSAFSLAVTAVSVGSLPSVLSAARVVSISVSDSAAHVVGGLDSLQSAAVSGRLAAITLTDGGTPTLSVTASQLNADNQALTKISSSFAMSIDASASANLTIVGIAGHANTVILGGVSTALSLSANGDGNGLSLTGIRAGYNTIDHLSNITVLQFTDQTLVVANSENANVARLYQAAFGRAPDAAGLAAWEGVYAAVPASAKAAGTTTSLALTPVAGLPDLAYGFTHSAEFQVKYGSLSNADFITQVYTNVLGRVSDPSGYAAWLEAMNTGGYTKEMVLVGFAESAENISNTAHTNSHTSGWLFLV